MVNIINVYAPTSDKVEKNSTEIESLYGEVEKLLTKFRKLKSSVTFIAGDFNSKVGKRENEETCMGRHSKGKRNKSGELLTTFCERNELFLANTSFKHPARHITTWSQQRVEKKTNTVKNVYNQIDYTLVDVRMKHCLMNARTYAGTKTQSDHRLLVTKIQADWTTLYKQINKKKTVVKRIDTRRLITEEKCRKDYEEKLVEKIKDKSTWEEISEVCQKTADEVLGFVEKEKTQGKIYNKEVERMSREQKEIRMKIECERNPTKIPVMKKERKAIQKKISAEVKRIREQEIDEIVEEIEKTKDDARMFKAVKKIDRKPYENPVVHDEDGKSATTPQEIYKIVREYFHKQFFKDDQEEVNRFNGPPKSLNRPITATEVAKATNSMSNGKASNGIAAEFMVHISYMQRSLNA